jgi:hypothetical protein
MALCAIESALLSPLLQVLNVQLQCEVKRMAALAGMTGQEWQPYSGQAVYSTAELVSPQAALKQVYVCIVRAKAAETAGASIGLDAAAEFCHWYKQHAAKQKRTCTSLYYGCCCRSLYCTASCVTLAASYLGPIRYMLLHCACL